MDRDGGLPVKLMLRLPARLGVSTESLYGSFAGQQPDDAWQMSVPFLVCTRYNSYLERRLVSVHSV